MTWLDRVVACWMILSVVLNLALQLREARRTGAVMALNISLISSAALLYAAWKVWP